MKLEIALNLIGTMPGKPDWNPDIASLYSLHLADWHPEVRQKAVLAATGSCKFRPTVAELKEIALKIAQPMPSLAVMREELRNLILFHPPSERRRHASPLMGDLIDELGGWSEVGMLPTEEMDRRFPIAAQKAREEYFTRNAEALLTQEPARGIASTKKALVIESQQVREAA